MTFFRQIFDQYKRSKPSRDGAGTELRIGIAMPTTMVRRWLDDGHNLDKGLRAKGYAVELHYAGDDVLQQIAQIRTMINNGAVALVIAAIDGGALKSVLHEAAEKGIKILAYDRLLTHTPHLDFYVSFDNFQVGVLQAKSIVQALKLDQGGGPFHLELFGGTQDDNNAHLFHAGAMSVLRPYLECQQLMVPSNELEMQEVSTMRWYSTLAVSRMISLLSRHYQHRRLHAVLSPLDGISIGILDSLKAMGYGKPGRPLPVVTGQDAEVASIRSIVAGEQASTIFKDTRALALIASEVVDELLAGRVPAHDPAQSYDNKTKPVPTRLLQPVLVDASNYREVLIHSGYIKAVDL